MEVLGLIFMWVMICAFIVAVPMLFAALGWCVWTVLRDR